MVQYQNLTRKPELFRAPKARALLGPGPGTMYPLNPPSCRPWEYHSHEQAWELSSLVRFKNKLLIDSKLDSNYLTLFYTGYLTNAFYTGGGGRGAEMPPYLTPKLKLMGSPNLPGGLVFTKTF